MLQIHIIATQALKHGRSIDIAMIDDSNGDTDDPWRQAGSRFADMTSIACL